MTSRGRESEQTSLQMTSAHGRRRKQQIGFYPCASLIISVRLRGCVTCLRGLTVDHLLLLLLLMPWVSNDYKLVMQ